MGSVIIGGSIIKSAIIDPYHFEHWWTFQLCSAPGLALTLGDSTSAVAFILVGSTTMWAAQILMVIIGLCQSSII
jgi:hypothetical protein